MLYRIGLGLAVFVVACLGVASAQPQPASAPVALDRIRVEAYVDGAVREGMRTHHIAGVTVAIVDRMGVVLAKGYGVAAVSPDRAVDADTLFRVGSISKTPTWIALMQLVEQGRIRLEDPINDHLPPDLRIPDDGYREPIRVRHLMTHSAGFEDSVLQGLFVRDPATLSPMNAYLRTHRVHRVRPPGVLSVYSNYGAALAGAIVAHVSGQPWQDYAEQHVLRPLGMASATYREPYRASVARARGLATPMPADVAARVTRGFVRKAGAYDPQPFEYVSQFAPAGALSASANDMAAYMRALLDPAVMEKAGVLRAATALEMRGALTGNDPHLGAWRHGFMDYRASRQRDGFGHGGDTIFQHSTMEIYPAEGVGVFVSVNTPTGVPLLTALPEGVLDAFVGPVAAPPLRSADAKSEAARVAGTYRSLRIASFRTERAVLRLISAADVVALPNGDILVGAGADANRFTPIGGGVFAQTDGPVRIAFREVAGRMRLFDPISAAPAERIGFFEGAGWLMLIWGAAAFVAVWGVAAAARRLILRDPVGRAAGWVLDGLCLAWLLAFALVGAAVAPWTDQSAVVFTYPGKLLPVAGWALMAAAIATPVAAVAALGPMRPRAWSWWRWTKQGAALTIFVLLALTLWAWGLLGYSGW